MANTYSEFVAARLLLGEDPNDIEQGIREALRGVTDWLLWGNSWWQQDHVCGHCGSSYPGHLSACAACGARSPLPRPGKNCAEGG